MPRNGSGVYSLPPGSTFTPNTLAQSSVVNGINADLATDLNTPRPIVAGGTGASTKIWEDMCVYATKAGNYTAVGTDNNAIHTYTAAATVALTPAGTLLANWHYTVIASGAAVTIHPNGAETINGAATLTIPNGTSAAIVCDGANFFTVFKPALWEPVGSGKYTLTAAASLSITDIPAFRFIRIYGSLTPNAASAGMFFRTSTNNGVSYDGGAADYTIQTFGAAGVSVGASTSNTAALAITNNTVLFVTFETIFTVFGFTGTLSASSRVYTNLSAGGVTSELNAGQRNSSTARNAFQIILGAGAASMTGVVYVEGSR